MPDFVLPAVEEYENFCMEADHYTKCPRFKVDCDAINCSGNGYTWQQVEARRAALKARSSSR